MNTWKLAVGVAAGILMAIFGYEVILRARAELAMKEMEAQAIAYQRAEAQRAAQQRAQHEAAQLEEANRQRMNYIHETQQAQKKEARELAWKRFYEPSASCKKEWTGECADTFIIAKRAFAAQYKDE